MSRNRVYETSMGQKSGDVVRELQGSIALPKADMPHGEPVPRDGTRPTWLSVHGKHGAASDGGGEA